MTRKKVKLVWIASDNARKASFKKRRVGLMKKVSELTTLCGVYAFAVVHGPDDDQPTIWPSRPVAQQLYRRYQSLPEVERQKKMTNQETYLKERTAKTQDQLKKHIKKNQELEMGLLMHQLNQGRQLFELSNAELLGLFWMVEEKMRESRKRIEYQQQVHRLPPTGVSPPLPSTVNEMDLVENSGGDGKSAFDQWFLDMVMNSSDKVGGSSSSMMGEMGTGLGLQSEANGAGFNGGNPMIEVGGDFGGRRGDETMSFGGGKGEDVDDHNQLLSQWNFGGSSSIGISEIEKLIGNINGVDDAIISPMDFSQQGSFGIGGYGGGYGGGEDNMGPGMFSHGGAGGSIGGSDAELLHGLFGDGGNENDVLSKGWPNIFTP